MNIACLVAVKFMCQDDDSDLDYELEAVPTVTPEASDEVVACVKVKFYTIVYPWACYYLFETNVVLFGY